MLVALLYLTDPVDALVVVIWILVYQQLENYLLSPRLTARTMALPAPVAFAAALIGGALGGILFAFLALPGRRVFQAAVRAYGQYYEVVTATTTPWCPHWRPVTPPMAAPSRHGCAAECSAIRTLRTDATKPDHLAAQAGARPHSQMQSFRHTCWGRWTLPPPAQTSYSVSGQVMGDAGVRGGPRSGSVP